MRADWAGSDAVHYTDKEPAWFWPGMVSLVYVRAEDDNAGLPCIRGTRGAVRRPPRTLMERSTPFTRRMLNVVGERERPNLGFARDVRAA